MQINKTNIRDFKLFLVIAEVSLYLLSQLTIIVSRLQKCYIYGYKVQKKDVNLTVIPLECLCLMY